MTASPNDQIQLINCKELTTKLSISRSSIYERINPKSKYFDSSFPLPIRVGRCTRWRLSEVQAWIESKSNERTRPSPSTS